MRTSSLRGATLIGTALAVALLGCGGGEAAAPVLLPNPVPPEPLPVLARLLVNVPSDTLRASESATASAVARDTKARAMTVGFIIWRSSDPAVLAVTSDGTIVAMAPGSAVLSARVGDVEGVRTITVLPPPPGPLPIAVLALTPFITDVEIGGSVPLVAIPKDYAGTPLADRTIAFSTSDTTVAIVAGDGTVTGRSAGVALIEVSSEGRRAAAYVRVTAPVDRSLVVNVAAPLEGTVISDSVTVNASVRATRPLASVVASISGTSQPMQREFSQRFSVVQEFWLVTLDVSSLPFGSLALVVTATDSSGRQGVRVVSLVRNTKVAGSGPGSGAMK